MLPRAQRSSVERLGLWRRGLRGRAGAAGAARLYGAYGWRLHTIVPVRLQMLPHQGEPIRCDPRGHCHWTALSAVSAARRRLYEASRGPLRPGARLEAACGDGRGVNLDHVRVVPTSRSAAPGASRVCERGHELSAANVVRHRDGRIAYCRLCRNARRRERHRTDPEFARRRRPTPR